MNPVSTLNIKNGSLKELDFNFLYFELATYGHHSTYIKYLVQYWNQKNFSGRFYILVSPEFPLAHPDIEALVSQNQESGVSLLTVEQEKYAALVQSPKSFRGRLKRAWGEWQLFNYYAKKLEVDNGLVASFDFFLLPFLFGAKPACPISGIYLKPTFHYSDFSDTRHQYGLRNFLPTLKEKLILGSILRKLYLKQVLCLDEFAVETVKKYKPEAKISHLPDPIENYAEQNKEDLPLNAPNNKSDRKKFLLFGNLSSRKGVEKLFEAIASLPTQYCKNMSLLIVGHCGSDYRQKIEREINTLRKVTPIEIKGSFGFIPDPVVQELFQTADIILAPYQNHVGMSGILLQAAAARKPVLSSDFGLMGELVRQYKLGIAIDSTNPEALAEGIIQALDSPMEELCDFKKMETLIKRNEANNFSRIIFETVKS